MIKVIRTRAFRLGLSLILGGIATFALFPSFLCFLIALAFGLVGLSVISVAVYKEKEEQK